MQRGKNTFTSQISFVEERIEKIKCEIASLKTKDPNIAEPPGHPILSKKLQELNSIKKMLQRNRKQNQYFPGSVLNCTYNNLLKGKQIVMGNPHASKQELFNMNRTLFGGEDFENENGHQQIPEKQPNNNKKLSFFSKERAPKRRRVHSRSLPSKGEMKHFGISSQWEYQPMNTGLREKGGVLNARSSTICNLNNRDLVLIEEKIQEIEQTYFSAGVHCADRARRFCAARYLPALPGQFNDEGPEICAGLSSLFEGIPVRQYNQHWSSVWRRAGNFETRVRTSEKLPGLDESVERGHTHSRRCHFENQEGVYETSCFVFSRGESDHYQRHSIQIGSQMLHGLCVPDMFPLDQ